MAQNQKAALIGKKSRTTGRGATQIVDEPEAGSNSMETNSGRETEIGPLEFGHIGTSFEKFLGRIRPMIHYTMMLEKR